MDLTDGTDRRWRLRFAGSIVLLLAGVAVCGLAGTAAVAARRESAERLASSGSAYTALVNRITKPDAAGSSEACVIDIGASPAGSGGARPPDLCIAIRSIALSPEDSFVRVSHVPGDPRRAVIVGNPPSPVHDYEWFVYGGLSLFVLGLLLMANALDRRLGEDERGRSWWVALAAPLGLTTWAPFAFFGLRGRRPRWLIWSGVYLVGIALALWFNPLHIPARGPANLGIVIVLIVWVGGMVHTMLIRTRANRAVVLATEHGRTTRSLPPPPDAALAAPISRHAQYMAFAELPWRLGADRTAIEVRSGVVVLHAGRAEGDALCTTEGRELPGTLVPTFQRWPAGKPNRFARCPQCLRVAPTGADEPATAVTDEPADPVWIYRNRPRAVGAAIGLYCFGLFWLVFLVAGGVFTIAPWLGFPYLLVTNGALAWVGWRWVQSTTTIGPQCLEIRGVRRTGSIPWSEVGSFAATNTTVIVQFEGGRQSTLAGLSTVGDDRGARDQRARGLNQAFGLTPTAADRQIGSLVELPATSPDARAVLHAESPAAGTLCGQGGRLVPTFRPWANGDHNGTQICGRCAELAPPRPAHHWMPSPPPPYRAPPRARAVWRYSEPVVQHGTGWGMLILVCAFVWPPIFRTRTEVSDEGILVVGLGGRRRRFRWSEIQGFDYTQHDKAFHRLVVVTRSNERHRIEQPALGTGLQPRQRVEALNRAFGLTEP